LLSHEPELLPLLLREEEEEDKETKEEQKEGLWDQDSFQER
jgi:hypothetical protein